MKIRRFSELQVQFSFFSEENFEIFKTRFFQSELGMIYHSVPWQDLVKAFGLKEKKLGRTRIFPPQGMLALMILKNYSKLSDKKLIEHLNGNVEWQFFCGISLGFERIDNFKVVSSIRTELSGKLDIEKVEKELYNYWNPHIKEKEKVVVDATCYESEVRYPTDAKLLWECVEWCNSSLRKVFKGLGERLPRTKYLKWKKRYVNYSKMRKKRSKITNAVKRSSLNLIDKISCILETKKSALSQKQQERLTLIKKVYSQQYALFHKGIKPKGRIVSLYKDYLRPIVRGKETKLVEFGAKLNKIQIDGISFIEHISFDAFNEGTRLKNSIYKA
ncbi:transposase [Chryseobacterium mucoviscidosis]|uniref:transposase n=1 Tax=Chryseobacterium mucoviscidosis TaxID=1945581 RepID=UPI0031DAE4A2